MPDDYVSVKIKSSTKDSIVNLAKKDGTKVQFLTDKCASLGLLSILGKGKSAPASKWPIGKKK